MTQVLTIKAIRRLQLLLFSGKAQHRDSTPGDNLPLNPNIQSEETKQSQKLKNEDIKEQKSFVSGDHTDIISTDCSKHNKQ